MMKLKALVSFTGAISMQMGQVKQVDDEFICNDLLSAGYVEVIEGPETQIEPIFPSGDKNSEEGDK